MQLTIKVSIVNIDFARYSVRASKLAKLVTLASILGKLSEVKSELRSEAVIGKGFLIDLRSGRHDKIIICLKIMEEFFNVHFFW